MPASAYSAATTSAGISDWPMFRGNCQRTGAIVGAVDIDDWKILWRVGKSDREMFLSSPVLADGRLYQASAIPDLYSPQGNIGALYCLDSETGKLLWKTMEKLCGIFSTPAISGRYLVFGEGLDEAKDCRILCFDIVESMKAGKGVKVWEYKTKSGVECSPVIYKDRVFVGTNDDGVYCLQLAPDENHKPAVVWHKDGKDYPQITSLIVHDNKVYCGLTGDSKGVICLDAESGKRVWTIESEYDVTGIPSISNDKLFIGMGTGDFVNSSEAVRESKQRELELSGKGPEEIKKALKALPPGGAVWCIDLKRQEVLWKHSTGQAVFGAIAIADGKTLFCTRNGEVFCLSLDGKELAKTVLKEGILSSPAVGEDSVYVSTTKAHLVALDRRTLEPRWKCQITTPSSLAGISSPLLGNGKVYVGTEKGGVVCVARLAREASTKPALSD